MAAITPAPSSSTPTPSKLSPSTARNAVNALLKWRSSKSKTQKPDLLDSDELVYLVVTLKKIPPKGRVNAYKIALPTPLHSQLTEFCLIYDDRPKSKLTKDQIQKKIKADNLPVAKILKFSKLKSDYKAFESKRKLLNSYDMFLADKQIVPLLPRLLGKQFFKKKKIPVPVDLLHKNWKEQIDRICGSALLFLSTGTCSVVRVAKTSMSAEEIVENVVSAMNGIVEIVPGNWGGVRSLHLKLLESIALPVYQTLPDATLKIEGAKEGEKVVQGVKEVVKSDSKDSKKEKVGKKKGRIHEVRYLDSNVSEVVDAKLGNDGVGNVEEGKVNENDQQGSGELKKAKRKKEKNQKIVGESNGKVSENDQLGDDELRKAKRKKEKVVGESNGKVSENDQLGSDELRKAKRKKGKVVAESIGDDVLRTSMRKRSNGPMNSLFNFDDDSDVAESNGDVVLRTSTRKRSKGPMNSLFNFDDDSDVEITDKHLRRSVLRKSVKEVKGDDWEKRLKKFTKGKDEDGELNGEKLLKKSAKVKDDAGASVEHTNDGLSATVKKKDVTKKKGDDLSGKGGESVGKKEKRQSEPVKLKSEEAKPKKVKRSKKAVE